MTDAPTAAPRTRKPRRPVDATALRRRIELAVERLISALDTMEAPAEDLEEDDPGGPGDDENGEAEPDEDGEPSLAAPEGVQQLNWCRGGDMDREEEAPR